MARKSKKEARQDIVQKRNQRADAIIQYFLLSDEFSKEYRECLRKIKEIAHDEKEYIESRNAAVYNLFIKKYPELELLNSQTTLGRVLIKSSDYEGEIETEEDYTDAMLREAVLKDGGRAVVPLRLDNEYLTVCINLVHTTPTIETELKSIVREHKITQNITEIPKPPTTEDLEILVLSAKGRSKGSIIREIKSKASITDDGARKRVNRAKKKIQE